MISNRCLSDESLRRLLLGELSAAEAAPLEQHLLTCPLCADRTRAWMAQRVAAGGHREDLPPPPADASPLRTHSSLFDETQAPGAPVKAGSQELLARFEPAAGPDELGRLGGFRVLQLLGQGGMGAVFLAEDMQLRRRVALKLLRPDQAAQAGAIERFLREARAAAAVRHDHVVTIYQVGQANGLPFIAQELLEGESLDERLKRERRLPVREALRIGREIATGLAAAHEQGLLHRDVKPGNVWLEERESGVGGRESKRIEPTSGPRSPTSGSPRTKLLDFGLARSQQGDEQLTHTGTVLGTPAFMSPEQAQGQAVDARTDLFSLGGVLYRMVTGRLPYQGTDVLSILRALAVDEPPPARSLNPEVPAELSRLIADLLHKDRQQRPATAAAAHARLAAIEFSWVSPPDCPASRPARRIVLAMLAVAACLLIALGIFLAAKTPSGQVPVELGAGVQAEEVKIEVQGRGAGESKGPSPAESAPRVSPRTEPPLATAPFSATEAKASQRAWADFLRVPAEYRNDLGMTFQLIPPGEFIMGQSLADAAAVAALHPGDPSWQQAAESSAPAHRVRLTKPFYLATHEVTQDEYRRVIGKNPAHFAAEGAGREAVAGAETSRFPVESIDIVAATEFCEQLSRQEKFATGEGYHLPTEAQWEFACRAGTTTAWTAGEGESSLLHGAPEIRAGSRIRLAS